MLSSHLPTFGFGCGSLPEGCVDISPIPRNKVQIFLFFEYIKRFFFKGLYRKCMGPYTSPGPPSSPSNTPWSGGGECG